MLKRLPLVAALAACLLLSSGTPARADYASDAQLWLSDGYYYANDNYISNPTDANASYAWVYAYYAQYYASLGYYYDAYDYGYYAYYYANQSWKTTGGGRFDGSSAYFATVTLEGGYIFAYQAYQQLGR